MPRPGRDRTEVPLNANVPAIRQGQSGVVARISVLFHRQ